MLGLPPPPLRPKRQPMTRNASENLSVEELIGMPLNIPHAHYREDLNQNTPDTLDSFWKNNGSGSLSDLPE